MAFQVQYDGAKYAGFAAQDHAETIENHLFEAFEKLNLIEDRKSCNYSRCGRTDRGVSAYGQVISLKVRSSIPATVENVPIHPCDVVDSFKEMDYCTMVNRVLPEDIRLIGCCPVTEEFSARFSAAYRSYRFFFTKKNLDIGAMCQACDYLIGQHDFRNFCKLDVANVSNFVREIYSAEIKLFRPLSTDESQSIYMLEIRGIAFLWHMVRCIMAVLFLVGERKESPEVVEELLNIEKNPSKPSFMMAHDFALVLDECGFDNLKIYHTPRNLWNLIAHFQAIYERHSVAAARAINSLHHLHMIKIRKKDAEIFKQELEAGKKRNSSKLLNKGIRAIGGEAEDHVKGSFKRKLNDVEHNEDAETQKISLVSVEEEISWLDALQDIEQTLEILPTLETAPHIPLMQRRKEESYEERLKMLGGQKRQRLDRNLSLPESAQFFQKMRQQGSLS